MILHRDWQCGIACIDQRFQSFYFYIIHQVNGFRVDWDLAIKISDLGLARALEEDEDYYRITSGKVGLPIRWAALESLTVGIFTTKSDVVSQLESKLDQV